MTDHSVGKPHYSCELPRSIGLPLHDTKQFSAQALKSFLVGTFLCRIKVSPFVSQIAYLIYCEEKSFSSGLKSVNSVSNSYAASPVSRCRSCPQAEGVRGASPSRF